MASTTILSGELARRAGVSRDTLRYYERKGLIELPQRSRAGYRLYPLSSVQRLQVIRGALALGFTIDELAGIFRSRKLNRPPCQRVRELALQKAEDLQSRISEMAQLRRELLRAVDQWEKILDHTKPGAFAHLLESFVARNPRASEQISPLISPGLREKLIRSRQK